MNAFVYPRQQERIISGAGAFGMHLLFIALLVFGVNWQRKVEPQVNIVDLYSTLPAQARPVEPPPQPELKPEPAPVPPPPPKAVVKPAPQPEIAKPDIALKDKAEKQRRTLEEKQKEAKKHEEEAKAAAAARQQQADAQRLAREQEEAQRKLAEQAGAARKSQMDKYKKAISDRIRRFIVLPPNMQGNPEAEFDVFQLPGGEVLDVKLKRSSNNTAYDNAIERAIRRAQPLPLPPDPALFQREISIPFRAYEK